MGSEQSNTQVKKIDLNNVDQNFRDSKFSKIGQRTIEDERFGKIGIIELDYGQSIFKKRLEFGNTKLFNNVRILLMFKSVRNKKKRAEFDKRYFIELLEYDAAYDESLRKPLYIDWYFFSNSKSKKLF